HTLESLNLWVLIVAMNQQGGLSISPYQQCLNFIGCVLILAIYVGTLCYTRYPLTLDILLTVLATEYNRYANESRRQRLPNPTLGKKSHIFRKTPRNIIQEVDSMALIVGYREDSELFARALKSYDTVAECRFILVGVDGDDAPDLEMIRVFKQAFLDNSAVIYIEESFGEIAIRTYEKLSNLGKSSQSCMEATISSCCQLARQILAEHNLKLGHPDGVKKLCLYQPHLHKKGIMFTSFIFSIVISEMIGVEYLWSSDSDTLVLPDTLRRTIETIAGDPRVGGSSAGLVVHNKADTITTRLASVVYWCQMHLARSTSAVSGTSDCQSGPSSAFRVCALPAILYPWYTQTVLGHRMVVNEDRHLTTNLIMRGWNVTFVSDVLAATDTPTTLSRWILQQVRWGRAGHIESIQQPKVYILTNPLFFWAAIKKEIGPLLSFFYILYYLLTGNCFAYFDWYDIGMHYTYTLLYNFLRNPDRTNDWFWVVPGLLFYSVPLPAIHLWSLITVFHDEWGTSMRSTTEMFKFKRAKAWKRWNDLGFFVVWMGIFGGTAARMTAQMVGWDDVFTFIVLGALIPSALSFYSLVVRE
ncbi:hypothetical protein N7495_001003, partial [Penicillium taxi]|uniref:uncharacterized protein n=1 Tax=Penicillium taxi TaxID=168475 RepID=UPI0025459D88